MGSALFVVWANMPVGRGGGKIRRFGWDARLRRM